MDKVRTILAWFYYGVMAAAVLVAVLGYYLVVKADFRMDPASDLSLKISYLVILYVILSVPLSLALFNKQLKKIRAIEVENERLRAYLKAGKLRILFIGLGHVLGIFFFYMLQEQSLLFAAGIAVIALYFCKPTQANIEHNLTEPVASDIDEI